MIQGTDIATVPLHRTDWRAVQDRRLYTGKPLAQLVRRSPMRREIKRCARALANGWRLDVNHLARLGLAAYAEKLRLALGK